MTESTSRPSADLAFAVLVRVLALGSGFATSVLLARILAPEELGNYFFIIAVSGLASVIGQGGLGPHAIRTLADPRAEGGRQGAQSPYVRAAVLGSLLAFLAAFSSLRFWTAASDADLALRTILAGGAMALLRSLAGVRGDLLRAVGEIRLGTALSGFDATILTAAFFGVVSAFALDLSLDGAILLTVLAWLPGWLLYSRRGAPLGTREGLLGPPNRASAFGTLGKTWPLAMLALATLLHSQADLLIVRILLSGEEAAVYGVASRVGLVISIPLTAANLVLAPRIAGHVARRDLVGMRRLTCRSAAITGGLAVVGFALLAAFGGQAIPQIFGPTYREAYVPALLIAGGQVLNVGMGSAGIVLLMNGLDRLVVALATSAALGTIVGSMVGAHIGGVAGVAAMSAIVLILYNVALNSGARVRVGLTTLPVAWGRLGQLSGS